MLDVTSTPDAADAETPAASPPTDFEIIDGGATIDIEMHDGTRDRVKVLLLTVRGLELLADLNLQSDIAEHYCGKRDKSAAWNLRNAYIAQDRLQQLLQNAEIDQIDAIEKKLASVRQEIEALEDRPKWADTLALESVIKIIETGERINRPRLRRWAMTQAVLTGAKRKMLNESISQSSSSSSAESKGDPRATS